VERPRGRAEPGAAAARAADQLLAALRDDRGRLLRVLDAGRAHVLAFLDDHAALLEACLDLYRAGAGERFLAAAAGLAADIESRFFDSAENDLFLTPSDGEPLVQRPRSDHDGATPHSTGAAVLGLLRAAALTGRRAWREIAERVLATHARALERMPEAFPTLARAAALASRGVSVAVVIGSGAAAEALAMRARFVLAPEDAVVVAAPGEAPLLVDPSWLAGREARGGLATAYVCRGTTCSLPITDASQLAPLPAGRTE
jgi:uncharacterized protein YyaL (SSP411 family)